MDKVERLNKALKEVKQKYDELKKCGMDVEILEIYLQQKTGFSRKDVRDFLANIDEFYTKLVFKEMDKKL